MNLSNKRIGIVESIQYPEYSYNTDECVWTIRKGTGAINLAIDVFEIKPENGAEFLIETATNGDLLLHLNKTQSTPSFFEYGEDVKIIYKSPGYSRLRFRFTNDENNISNQQCHGNHFNMNDNGRIVSVGFPMDNYQHNLDCHWRIWAPIGYGIKLNFNLVYLANKNDCGDRIEIYRGFQVTPQNKRFRNICETREKPLKIRLNFNMILLRFVTDVVGSDHGFMMTYTFYKIPSRDREHTYKLNNERKSLNDPLLKDPFILPCGCAKDRANQLPVIQNTKEPIGSTYPWLATVKVKKCFLYFKSTYILKNNDRSFCLGALIAKDKIVVNIDCPLQAVKSTVSLGYDIDNLSVIGEFSVVTFITKPTLIVVDIKPLFAFDWSPCPVCLVPHQTKVQSQKSKVIRRKSRLNKNMVELGETQISNTTPGLIITKSNGHTTLLGFNNEKNLIVL